MSYVIELLCRWVALTLLLLCFVIVVTAQRAACWESRLTARMSWSGIRFRCIACCSETVLKIGRAVLKTVSSGNGPVS